MRILTEEGVMLEDGFGKSQRIYEQGGEGANKWVQRRHQRRPQPRSTPHFESQGLTVSRLVRVGFGPIGLPNRLKRGQFYEPQSGRSRQHHQMGGYAAAWRTSQKEKQVR